MPVEPSEDEQASVGEEGNVVPPRGGWPTCSRLGLELQSYYVDGVMISPVW